MHAILNEMCAKTVSFLRPPAAKHSIGSAAAFQRRRRRVPMTVNAKGIASMSKTETSPNLESVSRPAGGAGNTIVLIGLMGAGKSTIGRNLADRLGLPFIDSDDEVVKAAGCTIEDIFEIYGETAFRDVEARVIQRLLEGGPAVIATGGGAFMAAETRERIRANAVSVWLKADIDVLEQRTSNRNDRPLLKGGDTRAKLEQLIALRYPVYAEADIVVETGTEPAGATVTAVCRALDSRADKMGAVS